MSFSRSTISSPSARRRERVRGRWNYQVDLGVHREKYVHFAKQLFGLSIPGLMISLPILLTTSRAGTELASWGLGIMTLLYIAVDAFARHREFKFFRLGPDLALGACFFFGILSIAITMFDVSSSDDAITALIDGLGPIRWIPLLYLFVYAWELFPGINRVMLALFAAVLVLSGVAWVQHFQGVDWITGETLSAAPTGPLPYFVPRGFLGSTEALATLFACVLPFPIAAACLRRGREETDVTTWIGFGSAVVLALALFFTYRPGLWWAGISGSVSLLLFPGDRRFKLFAAIAGTIALVFALLYVIPNSNPSESVEGLWHRITSEESTRSDLHRLQMNNLVKVWETAPILGTAHSSLAAGSGAVTGSGTGSSAAPLATATQNESVNVYFLILARGGLVGLALYLVFVLHHLLNTLRLFHEIPESHHKHRILAAGCFASQCAFHFAGLYWGTLTEAFSMNLFILVSSITLYMNEHYTHGLVPDDTSL